MAEDNGGPNGSEYRKKLRIAAQASITKFDRLQNAQTNNPEFGENDKATIRILWCC